MILLCLVHKRDFPTTPIYFSVPIPSPSPQYFSSHNTVAKATERKSFYEHACHFLSLVRLFLGQGSSGILAGGDDSWCSLRMVWCNYTPQLFIVQPDTGQKYPGWRQNPDSVGGVRGSEETPSRRPVGWPMSELRGGRDRGGLGSSSRPNPEAGSAPAHAGVSASSGSPIGNLHTEMGNGQAEAALGMPHRLQLHPVLSLHHDTNFQGSLKIQTKINKQSPDLPERNCWLSSEQSFGKTYFSCFPVLAVLSRFIYFYLLRLITVRCGTCSLPAPPQRSFHRLGAPCCLYIAAVPHVLPPCLRRLAATLFVLEQGEVGLVKPCSLQVTPASSCLRH